MSPTAPRDAHGALWGKNVATLSGGVYGRPGHVAGPAATNLVHERNLSRYSSYKGTRDGTMAMGVVEALLAALAGSVQTLSCDGDALAGRVRLGSLSSTGHYDFSWDGRDRARLVVGGFPTAARGDARPTYHAALVGLVVGWTAWRVRGGDPGELLDRWWALLTAMERLHPRRAGATAWTRAQIADSCRPRPGAGGGGGDLLRDLHEGLADSLWLHLRYQLPATTTDRALLAQVAPVLAEDAGLLIPFDPADLLRVPAGAATSGPPETDNLDPDPDLDLADDPGVRAAVDAATATVRDAAAEMIETADVPRIRAAISGPGAVFLLGPAGQGKTEWAKRLAAEYLDGFELVQLTPRVHEEDLYGTNVQDREGRWTLAPGPVTRFAARVAAGARLALILDEFPRAHASLRDGVMALVNTHSAADLADQGLSAPDAPGPYHLVVVPGYATYALPAARVKIVATGNLGESYRGLDLGDAAFLDRWTSWLHLAPLTPDETRLVLARRTGLAPTHPVLGVLVATSVEIATYHAANAGALRAGVTLRTLIRWGAEIARVAGTGTGHDLAAACVRTARGQWLDKVCPMKGDALDPTVYAELLEIVERAARALIR